ncbi:CDP-glycerol glycerophosphotransferase family protein [Zestomonas thermotolerans]|uniref:CDP-glycerol glycerophosphotransferase family protein n=1 Tax=Zestomonas thermotolerans TaxID=157784 RepID=UPI0009DAE5EF|nr:CDP-glycerol glycerophosphotransferase family protein [Pseudomonas thermotolerans]
MRMVNLRSYIIKALCIFVSWAKILFAARDKRFKNSIIFSSYNQGYKDNAKYFFEYMVGEGYNAFYVVADGLKFTSPVDSKFSDRFLTYGTKEYYKALKQCRRFFFTHSERDIGWYIPKRSSLVNLWHGSPIKKMGYDSPQDLKWLSKYHAFKLKTPYDRWDYILVASDYFKDFFKSSLRYGEDKIIVNGLPRNSALAQQGLERADGRKKYLYAPTYRSEGVSIERACEDLKAEFRGLKDSVLYIRLHPFDFGKLPDGFFEGNIINANSFEDVYSALQDFDALITDYSSIAFDYAITGRPIHLYCPDLESYTSERGGLYIDIENLPFYLSRSAKELVSKLGMPPSYDPSIYSAPPSCSRLESLLISKGVISEDIKN